MTNAELLAELANDPAGVGYKNSDGTFRTAAEIGWLLASPHGTVANPEPQPSVPASVTIQALAAVAPTTLGALSVSDLEPIAARVRDGDREGVQRWADVLLMKGIMPQSEHDAVTALIAGTTPDPAWPATVPGPSRLETAFGETAIQHSQITAVTGVA